MPKLILTYFDFDGGRGEAARLIMYLGGLAFEDKRVPGKDWPALRDTMPFQAMPVLEVDGKVITQSNTINRYLGRLAGLYSKDEWQATLADEVMDAVEDISTKIGNTIGLENEAKKKAREALAADAIPRFLQQIETRLKAGGGEWFFEKRLTVADIKCFLWVRWLKSGALDHVPADIVDRHAPLLAKHLERVRSHPKIAGYYAARGK